MVKKFQKFVNVGFREGAGLTDHTEALKLKF